jgi:glycogen synthase
VAAYARIGAFGLTFKGTTFLHICHNLMEDYEGRVFPEPRDGWLQNVHQLPKDWLIDPSWSKNMINPSRTAILISDQWSTVSKSYRDDLLQSSPLSAVLKLKD